MIHAALDEWLAYRPSEVKSSGMVQIGETLDEISRAYNDCVIGRMPDYPFMTIDNTTFYDPTRTPKGKHTMWNFIRAPTRLNGRSWTEKDKDVFADRCIERLSEYAPNAKRIVLKRKCFLPRILKP